MITIHFVLSSEFKHEILNLTQSFGFHRMNITKTAEMICVLQNALKSGT